MKLLLLAGTTEARVLAERLAGETNLEVTASLAGATDAPRPLAVPTRIGGFGGAEQQAKWMKNNRITHVIDATHPFAARISARSQAICADLGLGYLRLERPGWQVRPGDLWRWVDGYAEAAATLPAGARVFLATGRQSLPAFAARDDLTLYLRRLDPAAFPLVRGGYVIGSPGDVEEEMRLFKELQIDLVVSKDAGGPARAKLDAARALGLEVVMIRRPPPPPGARSSTVSNVAQALDWLARQA